MAFLETILKCQGFPLSQAEKELSRIQFQNNLQHLLRRDAILRHHIEKNDWYKNIVGSLPKNWENLPVLLKKDFQHPIEDILSRPYKKKDVYIGNTSGSSGHPFYFAKDKFSHAISYALIENRYRAHGLGLEMKQARFYGIPLKGKSRWIELLKDVTANRVRFPVFDLSEAAFGRFLRQFKVTKFDYLYGYTSALALFSRYLKENEINLSTLCPTLKACIVTSEVCTSEDSLLIHSATGVPVLNEYGASELSIIAFPDKEGDWILSDETLYVEVLDENNQPVPDGKEGRIVITSLFNKAMPFIRYDIGDMGAIERGDKSRLLRLTGRTNDTIQLPSGRRAAGLTFYYISRSILESNGSLKEFIIRQTTLDSFEFDVVSSLPLGEKEIQLIEKNTAIYLEKGLKIIINQVPAIERPASGKIKHFYSEINKHASTADKRNLPGL